MKLKYSIIIPHQDSLDLLKRALLSIPDREDIQIIVIDNSTLDLNFGNLNKTFRASSFLLLSSDPEKGAGHARNVGLREAKGKWLLFLDADDFFNPAAFEKFDMYSNTDYDIVYFSLSSVFSDTLKLADRHIYNNILVEDFITDQDSTEDNLRYRYITPYCKLIRNVVVVDHNLQFDEVPAGNDMMFSIKTGYYAKTVTADKFNAYCVTETRGSLTNTINIRNSRSRFNTGIRQYKYMISIGKPQMRFPLMALVITSLGFGLKEFFWSISTVYKERVNIFLGFERWPGAICRYFFNRKKKKGNVLNIKKK
jgi:glycosyltransferase involved in cell wall biosynthesis